MSGATNLQDLGAGYLLLRQLDLDGWSVAVTAAEEDGKLQVTVERAGVVVTHDAPIEVEISFKGDAVSAADVAPAMFEVARRFGRLL